jgi:hypothetical protein
MLGGAAFGGDQSLPLPAPQTLIPEKFFCVGVLHLVPGLGLKWLLLDFGGRGATMDAAKERLLAANLGFNRSQQGMVVLFADAEPPEPRVPTTRRTRAHDPKRAGPSSPWRIVHLRRGGA